MGSFLADQNEFPRVVFFFGAGSSYSQGIPLQSEIFPQILKLEGNEFGAPECVQRVKLFVDEHFKTKDSTPNLEEIFGFIEYFIREDMVLGSTWRQQELRELKRYLIKCIHYVISKPKKENDAIHEFWNNVKLFNKEIAIITTNYDCLLEDNFGQCYPDMLLDFCVDFANFEGDAVGLHPFNWWDDATKPGRYFENSTRIKLLKVHGSLNWRYCECCERVFLTPFNNDLKPDKNDDGQLITHCPYHKIELGSILRPPSHVELNSNYLTKRLMREASKIFETVEHLVFIGYSFPEADVHLRAILRRSLNPECYITVINKSRSEELIDRYLSINNRVMYRRTSFEDFVQSRRFKDILETDGKAF